jgi:hypothetical protein
LRIAAQAALYVGLFISLSLSLSLYLYIQGPGGGHLRKRFLLGKRPNIEEKRHVLFFFWSISEQDFFWERDLI